MTLDNEFINLGEIDTGYEEPSKYIFKRMVDQLAEQMNGMIVNEHSYETPNTVVQQTTMIVDGKPHVMGSHSVMDGSGFTIMTSGRRDEDFCEFSKVGRFEPPTKSW
ncbi:hypothetical protein HA402_002974 [Bradysia odoriphaga]|nr:hypothetical protein HA402_002974 [Bradysia odoriphaga]